MNIPEDIEQKLQDALLDQNFEKLELAMREPNIFRALNIERQEIRHSNFFAYLLDPRENHGLRDIVLRKFLRDIFADDKADGRSFFDADLLDLSDVEIRREWKNIDILILLRDDVIIVENKVDSGEHSAQLKRYRAIIRKEFAEKKCHFVFLTVMGLDPGDEDDQASYMSYTYERVSHIIENILDVYSESIGEKVGHYLQDYLTVVKQELLMNDRLNELAAKVYKAHADAFDFVFENRPDPATILYSYFEEEIKSRGYEVGSRNKGYIRFTTKRLAEALPKLGEGWPDKEIFLFEIDYYWTKRNAIGKAVISPGNSDLREKLLEAVRPLHHLFSNPTGKKWWVLYMKKMPFVAADVISEDPGEIRKKVSSVVDAVVKDADEIFAAISNLPELSRSHS